MQLIQTPHGWVQHRVQGPGHGHVRHDISVLFHMHSACHWEFHARPTASIDRSHDGDEGIEEEVVPGILDPAGPQDQWRSNTAGRKHNGVGVYALDFSLPSVFNAHGVTDFQRSPV